MTTPGRVIGNYSFPGVLLYICGNTAHLIYQLPTGKIIYLSIEEYLDLTDQDIQYLISINAGHYSPVRNPFMGSAIEQQSETNKENDSEEETEDEEEEEETPAEDFPEIPDIPPDLGLDQD